MQIPILKTGPILITSLPAALTDQEAIQLQDDILAEVARTDVKGLVIDITALDVVDSFMARVLSDTADMVELMGTQTVIVGMRPLVAVTLVQMGRRLVGVETALNLEKGLARLRQLIEGPVEGSGDETDTTGR